MCQVSNRYAKSSSYTSTQESDVLADAFADYFQKETAKLDQGLDTYIWYYDVNNLYGAAMMKPLPLEEYVWEKVEGNILKKILNIPDDAPKGYYLEVDISYPEHLHDLHKDLPLAPELLKLKPSPFMQGVAEKRK